MTTEPAENGTDYYLLDDFLTAEDRALRLKVRTFVDTDLLPVINDYWDRAEFPLELVPKLAALGIVGSTIEGYGCPGLTRLAAGMVAAEVSRGDGSVNTFLGVQSGLAMGIDQPAGQRGAEAALAAGDGHAGQDRRVRPDRAGPRLRLGRRWRPPPVATATAGCSTARKRWIGNASIADVVVVWARDNDDGKVKAFVVERSPDGTYPDGYSAELITGKIGKRAMWQPDVTLHDVRVPVDNKLAEATRSATPPAC